MNEMDLKYKLKILSYYQIIGGIIGLGLILNFITSISTYNWPMPFILFMAIGLYGFSILSGIIIIKDSKKGLKYSKANQLLQVFHFSILGYSFQYISGFHLSVGLNLTSTIELLFSFELSAWQAYINKNDPTKVINLNIIALYLILFIDKALAIIRGKKET